MENGTKNTRGCRTVWAKCRLCKELAEQKNLWRGSCGPQGGISKSCKKDGTEKCQVIEALIARQLIPLDKIPGVRPNAMVEVSTRILSKCIMAVMREDVKLAAGNLQVCIGHQAGGEATIHAMKEIFKGKEVEAAILVDATNAFNSINREAVLHNIAVKCPEINRYAQNCYGKPSKLFIVYGKKMVKNAIFIPKRGQNKGIQLQYQCML